MLKHEVSWAAGFYEGEGSIHIHYGTGGWRADVSVTQNLQDPLKEFVRLFGGHIYKQRNLRKGTHIWKWMLSGKQAIPFLDAIRPYVRTARRRKEILVYKEFYSNIDPANRLKCLAWWCSKRK